MKPSGSDLGTDLGKKKICFGNYAREKKGEGERKEELVPNRKKKNGIAREGKRNTQQFKKTRKKDD